MQTDKKLAASPDRRFGPRSRYALRLIGLDVGEGFTAPLVDRALVATTAIKWGRVHGRRYRTRKVSHERFRVERVA